MRFVIREIPALPVHRVVLVGLVLLTVTILFDYSLLGRPGLGSMLALGGFLFYIVCVMIRQFY